MDRQTVLRHIRKAERHVAEGGARIAECERTVAELERNGRDATEAKELLKTLLKSQLLRERNLEIFRAELADLDT
jgi:hypothetical protein